MLVSENMQSELEAEFPWMVQVRRALHQHPELAFEEKETARRIMAELDRLGIAYDYAGVGGAVIGRQPSPDAGGLTIALRAEMDALPGNEKTTLPFASTTPGKMHACGHDAHMAMVLGAAALLAKKPARANVLFVFQPAEERGGGARVVLQTGALDGVRAIFGGHVTHHYRVGEIMVADGTITAQSDRFEIRIRGKGGHGARPHEAVDAVVICGLLISAVQTLVSRQVNPIYPSVVTIGMVKAGTAANVIAEDAELAGTIRTTSPLSRTGIHTGLARMAKSIGDVYGAEIQLTITPGYPPVVNTVREANLAREAAIRVVGENNVTSLEHPSMGSEDFSFYLEKIPGCYVRFGARLREGEYLPLHSPSFDIHEDVLQVGAAFFAELARVAAAGLR